MGQALRRHFVATAFVVYRDAVLLHWHRKLQAWLPPGGHVEPNEDPVQTALRETLEETGLEVEVVPTRPRLPIGNLEQVDAPYTILIEDIPDDGDGEHQHIDFVYFAAPRREPVCPPLGWRWFTREELSSACAAYAGASPSAAPPEDVRKLGAAAIAAARAEGA